MRVFIPAPFFPPSAMPPSQRVRLLIRHLHSFGWEPVIFTVDQSYREEPGDPWMEEITGTNFILKKIGCLDQRKTRKFGIGDLGLRMFFPLFFSMKKEAKILKPDLILYPVPPWYIMVMAPILKWITGIPYAIDFIDPWIYDVKGKGTKAKISQWIARLLEGFVVRKSNAVFAVSQGILDKLAERYPVILSRPMVAVPYGVEPSDYLTIKKTKNPEGFVLIRYTGAISDAMLPVVNALFRAITKIKEEIPLKVEFTGTSYAGVGLVKPVVLSLIESNNLSKIVTENPARVAYRTALELSLEADLQLLIGDTTPYYAASKLMGLAASGKPFFALIHKGSFPEIFLDELQYRNKAVFTTENLNKEEFISELAALLKESIITRASFKPIDMNNPKMLNYTAYSMTKIFADNFQKIIYE